MVGVKMGPGGNKALSRTPVASLTMLFPSFVIGSGNPLSAVAAVNTSSLDSSCNSTCIQGEILAQIDDAPNLEARPKNSSSPPKCPLFSTSRLCPGDHDCQCDPAQCGWLHIVARIFSNRSQCCQLQVGATCTPTDYAHQLTAQHLKIIKFT